MLATSAICFTLFATSAAFCIRRAAGFDKMAHLQGLGPAVLAQSVGSLPKVPVLWRLRPDTRLPAAPRNSIATPVSGAVPARAAGAVAYPMPASRTIILTDALRYATALKLATTLANSSADHGGSK
jgi:hypothetical protein